MHANIRPVKLTKPSGTTLVTVALLILLPTLAVLQYQWVGQLSTAARERLQRNVRIAAAQFREGFDGELVRAVLSLQVGPATAREGVSERYSDRYNTWLNTAGHPQIVSNVLVVDADKDQLRLRRWNPDIDALEAAEWRQPFDKWRAQVEQEFRDFNAGRAFDRRPVLRGEDSLVLVPLRNLVVPARPTPGPQTVTPVFGFTIIELNMPYIREQMLPELASRHFTHVEGDVYRVAVTATDDSTNVLYRSDPDAPVDQLRADASAALFGIGSQAFFFGRPPRPPVGDTARGDEGTRLRTEEALAGRTTAAAADDFGRWRLLVQHQSGSLEAAVARARRQNLAISFGVLLLLTVSIALLAATSRRAHRLARQQMEFVAGVSHELRTPVAVIRSAAENLSHGVVDSGDRVKRYGRLLETEARRLGEMVERVLQYAGIESGLATGVRVPLAPTDIIEGAIESSITLLGARAGHHRAQFHAQPADRGWRRRGSSLRRAEPDCQCREVRRPRSMGGHQSRARPPASSAGGLDHRERSWRRAFRHPSSRTSSTRSIAALMRVARQVHGNGLGLSLVRQIVAAHSGRVTVTTRAGAGSSFTIALPSAEPDQRAAAVASQLQTTHS